MRYSVYQDSLGFWTLGMGTLVDARKGGAISDDVVNLMATEHIERDEMDLSRALPWWSTLDEPRARALANMTYQLGLPNLLEFTKMLAALKDGKFAEAATHALDSRWAKQTPARANRIAAVFRTGQN